jgi:hypothetical protein
MQRCQLEHLIRAAGAIVEQDHLIVIGSQAILASIENPPAELVESMEADLYPRDAPEAAIVIDGTIGELSMFHETFGYYGHGVGPETATLAQGWQDRLVPICSANTDGVTGWCLSILDLAFSKLAAGREKDLAFVRQLLVCDLVSSDDLAALVDGVEGDLNVRLELARP